MEMTNLNVKNITVKGFSLLSIRVWFYSLAFLNLFVTGVVALTIDMTVDEDPKVRAYYKLRWYLLTCWFNMMTFPYIPLCMYCDWQEVSKADSIQLNKLRRVRDFFMTAILFPVTVYSDMAFWALFLSYPELIASPRLYDYIPPWTQHSVHTVSLGFVIMDLLLTPRLRPSSHRPGLTALYGFMIFYTVVVYVNYTRGDMVYSFLETASGTTCVLVVAATLALMTICYYVQWYIVDYVWNNDMKLNVEVKENRVKKFI